MTQHPFLSAEKAAALAERFGTPLYVYDEKTLRANAAACLAFPNAFGLTVRFAIKACPNAAVLRLFLGCIRNDYSSHFFFSLCRKYQHSVC